MTKPKNASDSSEPLNLSGMGSALPDASGLSAADRAGLVSMIQDKLDSLAGQSSGYIESLPKRVRRRVLALQKFQSEHDDLEEKFFEEKAALEAKYQKLYAPLYDKRSEIVNGVVEAEVPKEGEEEEEGPDVNQEEGEDIVGIPEFWLTAMKTNEIVADQITERDDGALKHLKDIRCVTLEEGKGFRLDFYFSSNPYFSNEVLSKTYHMLDLEDPILERADGTEINWLPGKNLTQKVLKKKVKKGAKASKPITKTEQCESFFNFFSPPQVPGENEEIDEEEAQNLQELMEQDYDIGSALKDKIIPHAVAWFTGEALDNEYDDGDEDGDEDDEDFDDDEDEDDDDDDDEPPAPARRTAASGKAGKKGGEGEGEQPPECKQQ